MIIIKILIFYLIGFGISLYVFHKFKDQLGINSYDPPHCEYYDDYESNAEAYVAFSFMWPIYWIVMGVVQLWRGLVYISKKIEKKCLNT